LEISAKKKPPRSQEKPVASIQMAYTVWLFTRPLSFFPSFGITSDGKPALRHWGVLISELTLLDVQVIMQRTRGSLEEDTTLGTMYELFPEEGYGNVHIIRPFGILRIRNEWHSFSAQYIGTTLITLQMIDHEGNPLGFPTFCFPD
jgi:hypothetical protein